MSSAGLPWTLACLLGRTQLHYFVGWFDDANCQPRQRRHGCGFLQESGRVQKNSEPWLTDDRPGYRLPAASAYAKTWN